MSKTLASRVSVVKDQIVRIMDNPKERFQGLCSIQSLQQHFGLNPEYEQDRAAIWRLGQAVAELLRGPLPVLVPVDNGLPRTYRFR